MHGDISRMVAQCWDITLSLRWFNVVSSGNICNSLKSIMMFKKMFRIYSYIVKWFNR